ncbi:MAG: sigma-70 family RNA polymerase sigma factor [Solirubrobacteraceae bacterium]
MSAAAQVSRIRPGCPANAQARQAELVLAARSGRPGARAEFVESFMPLIRSVAQIYRHVPGIDGSELVQEGVVGVLRALERYDPGLGAPFWAYASWWVRQAMQQLVAELSRPVVLSDRALRQLARVRSARRNFVGERAREPTLRELAAASDLTVEQLQRLTAADRQPRGLDEPLHAMAEGGATFGDMVRDPVAEEAYEEAVSRREVSELPRLLERVTERERIVIEVRYGLDGTERTLRELGQMLGVSAERVRQIEQTALEKMRTAYPHSPHPAPRALGALTPATGLAAARVAQVEPSRSSGRRGKRLRGRAGRGAGRPMGDGLRTASPPRTGLSEPRGVGA